MAFCRAIGNLKKTLHVACIDTKLCIIQIIALVFLIFIHTWHGLRVINYQFAGKSKVESSNLKQTTKDLNFIVTKTKLQLLLQIETIITNYSKSLPLLSVETALKLV